MYIGFVCFLAVLMIGCGTGALYLYKRMVPDYHPLGLAEQGSTKGALIAIWLSTIPTLACASCLVIVGDRYPLLWLGITFGMLLWGIVTSWTIVRTGGDMAPLSLWFHPEKRGPYFAWRRQMEQKEFELRRHEHETKVRK